MIECLTDSKLQMEYSKAMKTCPVDSPTCNPKVPTCNPRVPTCNPRVPYKSD